MPIFCHFKIKFRLKNFNQLLGIINTVFYLEGAQKVCFLQDHSLTSANVKLISQKTHYPEPWIYMNNMPYMYYSYLHLVFSPISVHTWPCMHILTQII